MQSHADVMLAVSCSLAGHSCALSPPLCPVQSTKALAVQRRTQLRIWRCARSLQTGAWQEAFASAHGSLTASHFNRSQRNRQWGIVPVTTQGERHAVQLEAKHHAEFLYKFSTSTTVLDLRPLLAAACFCRMCTRKARFVSPSLFHSAVGTMALWHYGLWSSPRPSLWPVPRPSLPLPPPYSLSPRFFVAPAPGPKSGPGSSIRCHCVSMSV